MLSGKRVHAFDKKGTCFFEKGCTLFHRRIGLPYKVWLIHIPNSLSVTEKTLLISVMKGNYFNQIMRIE